MKLGGLWGLCGIALVFGKYLPGVGGGDIGRYLAGVGGGSKKL